MPALGKGERGVQVPTVALLWKVNQTSALGLLGKQFELSRVWGACPPPSVFTLRLLLDQSPRSGELCGQDWKRSKLDQFFTRRQKIHQIPLC